MRGSPTSISAVAYDTNLTSGGAAVTITLNLLWIPTMGYMGSAWATLICYGLMAVVSYILGRRYYPVPYEALKVCLYILLSVILYEIFAHATESVSPVVRHLSALGFMLLFSGFAWVIDGRRLPELLRGETH